MTQDALPSPTVVALVPTFNCASSIAATVEALFAAPLISQVIVIDDGSSDDSGNVAARTGADVIRLEHNSGKSAALRAGLAAANDADIYLLVDADTGASAGETVRLLPAVINDRADLAIGILPAADGRGGFGYVTRLSQRLIANACGFAPAAPLSGQRAVRGALLRRLELGTRFGTEVAMTIEAAKAGARIEEQRIAVEHHHRGRTVGGFLHRARQGWDVLGAAIPRVIPPLVRLTAMITLVAVITGIALAHVGRYTPPVGEQLPQTQSVDVVIVPSWTWGDVAFDGSTPYAFRGLTNVIDPSRPYAAGSVATGKVENVVQAVAAGSREANAKTDPRIRIVVEPLGVNRFRPTAQLRVIVGVSVMGEKQQLRPIIVQGLGVSGQLQSSATKRAGIVDLTQIAPTVRYLFGDDARSLSGSPLRVAAHDDAADAARATEQRIAFYDRHQAVFVALLCLAFLCVVGYAAANRQKRRTRGIQVLSSALAATPLCTWLTQGIPVGDGLTGWMWTAAFLSILGAIVVASRRFAGSSTSSLRRILLATIVVVCVDLLRGGTLQFGGFLGSSPALGARYYGSGNVTTALLIVATVLWSTLHVAAAARVGIRTRHRGWSRAAAVSYLVALTIGIPGVGSDVGGLFTATVIFGGLFLALHAGTFRKRRAVTLAVLAVIGIVAAAILDAQRSASQRTHLGETARRVQQDGPSALFSLAREKVDANLFGYGFPWTLLIVAVAVGFLAMLLRGRFTDWLPSGSVERFGSIAAVTAGLVAYGVNDSGIVTLVVVFVFLGPFLNVVHRNQRWGTHTVEVSAP